MVAMPYILVNIVLDMIGLTLFGITSAALLSKYPRTNRFLPAWLRSHKTLAFAALALVLLVLSIVVVRVLPRGHARFLFELFFYIGLANSVVLTYQFLAKRWFRNTPKVQRRVLIAACAVVFTFFAAVAVATAVTLLFTIR